MARCFYILFNILFLACSGGNPARHLISGKEWRKELPFITEGKENAPAATPLHYSLKVGSENGYATELSYSFIITSGDSAIWEEGVIRIP